MRCQEVNFILLGWLQPKLVQAPLWSKAWFLVKSNALPTRQWLRGFRCWANEPSKSRFGILWQEVRWSSWVFRALFSESWPTKTELSFQFSYYFWSFTEHLNRNTVQSVSKRPCCEPRVNWRGPEGSKRPEWYRGILETPGCLGLKNGACGNPRATLQAREIMEAQCSDTET